jgi:DNA modification methylase
LLTVNNAEFFSPIVDYLSQLGCEASVSDIERALVRNLGKVASSSVRSYLNLNTPSLFERTSRGHYKLCGSNHRPSRPRKKCASFHIAQATVFHADCFDWLARQEAQSIHAVVTDPPYGVLEYSKKEQSKLRNGRGGVWRIPLSLNGHKRMPTPRFTVLDDRDKEQVFQFFRRLGALLERVVVPGANIVVASNPLLFHIVATALSQTGLEPRGSIARLVMTMRGGDRPKNAHEKFAQVSVMPRSMWEPWLVFRRPIDGRVQDNLRRWKTGGFLRTSTERPFGDVIKSQPTPRAERRIAPHPSLKPQAFLRQIVRAALPLGTGTILDPFAGSGSVLAAANAIGYQSVGVEVDAHYYRLAKKALPALSEL